MSLTKKFNIDYLNQLSELNNNYIAIDENDFFCDDKWDNFSQEIREQKCDQITSKEVAAE